MRPSETSLNSLAPSGQPPVYFGTFLKLLRHRYAIKQLQVLAHLPGWTQANYSRLESGELAPAFDQLRPIAAALQGAGVAWTPLERQQFLALARERIETKKTYREHKTEQQWDELRLALARLDTQAVSQEHTPPAVGRMASRPRLLETRHLVGREHWFASLLASLHQELPKKLIVLHGPVGIGKSSELHRLALHLLRAEPPRPHVLLCELPAAAHASGPQSALDVVLATLLVEVGPPDLAILAAPLEARIAYTLDCLEKTARPLVLLVDNGEHLLDEQGRLASCWQQFLGMFLCSQHCACLVLATKEWPGWCGGERVFVAEQVVPALSAEAGAQVLQQLGLASVARQHLQQVSQAVGGVPLCLEWVAALVQEPLLGEDWQGILEEAEDHVEHEAHQREHVTQRLLGLLEDPALFGGHVAATLTPLLERILQNRLSAQAIDLLHVLSLANLALGKAAVQRLCSHPRVLKELRDVSLLMAYPHRVHVLPMVAALVRARLSPAQQQQGEEHLIDALSTWLQEGKAHDREMGAMIAELALLYLKQHRLLEAAQLLIRYGWISFHQGDAPRLARRATEVMESFDWHTTEENECGSLLLHHLLSPFLGKTIDYKKRAKDYQRIQDAVLAGKVILQPPIEVNVTHQLMLCAMSELCFEKALTTLEASRLWLEQFQVSHPDLEASLLEEHALLLARWSEHAKEQGETQKAALLREQTIELYRQCIRILSTAEERSPLNSSLLKRCLARCLNNLGYHLNSIGEHEEALQVVESSIALKEQGYVYIGALAASYGEKSQILAALGHFQEALLFDEKALAEIQRCANAGDSLSQEEMWMYRVNRGRLYLRVGRVSEAEQLLQEALPHIHPRRRVYQMFAKEALEEIEQWRLRVTSSRHQLDWRWIEHYRELDAFDAYWWWAQAGPFTQEEQQQWDQLFAPNVNETTKLQLDKLIVHSRERELTAAIAEQREPRLRYPAIEIEEVRCRISALLQLDAQINQQEPNAIVRRLYHEKIEEETCFLRMIEATYEGNSEKFWEFSRLVYHEPTAEEMDYALSHVKRVLQRGLRHPETANISSALLQLLRERLCLSFDLSHTDEQASEVQQISPASSAELPRMITALAAKRFFEAALRESGYDGWQVVIDPKASAPRVESGLRQLFLQDCKMSLDQVRHYLAHELAGHIARSVAGDHSSLGLLAIGTKNYSPTEEGLALYHERQVAMRQGKVFNDWSAWFGTLVTGVASGVVTPPQTFLSLFTFLELFFLLWRLLDHLDEDIQHAQEKSRRSALSTCLRVYRGVPDLQKAGLCLSKDAVYLRGLWLVEHAVAQDERVLDYLAVGKVAIEYLPDLQELGIVAPPQPLRQLVLDPDLDAYMLSFEERIEHA